MPFLGVNFDGPAFGVLFPFAFSESDEVLVGVLTLGETGMFQKMASIGTSSSPSESHSFSNSSIVFRFADDPRLSLWGIWAVYDRRELEAEDGEETAEIEGDDWGLGEVFRGPRLPKGVDVGPLRNPFGRLR